MKEETSPISQEGDIDESIKNAEVFEVRCGMLTGKMHMNKFVCPGIHQNCIEHEGKMISPKMFTVLAQKDKQKDWKGSIRIGRTNLRSLMEMKTFDFFEHDKRCSLKCQSRNYISARLNNATSTPPAVTPIQRISFSSADGDHAATTSFYATSPSAHSSLSNASTDSTATTLKNSAMLQSVLQAYASQTVRSADATALANLDLGLGIMKQDTSMASSSSDIDEDTLKIVDCEEEEEAKPSSSDENLCTDIPTTSAPALPGIQNTTAATTQAVNSMNMNNALATLSTLLFANSSKQEMFKKLISQSPADFWNTAKSLGLIEDLFNDLTAALNYMKQTYLNGAETSPAAAATLSRVTAAFDLEKSFSEKTQQQLMKAQLNSLVMNMRNVQTLQAAQQLISTPLVDRNMKRKSPCSNQILVGEVSAKQFCARNNQV